MAKQLWVISEIYYPEEIGTGYYLTGLAEGLCSTFNVNVLCGYPTYAARGAVLPPKEVRNGIRIERCQGTTFNKDVILLRLVNLITISISIFLKTLFRIRRGDIVLVVTNPPLMPFVARIVCRLRSAKCVLKLDDVYPEILIATGIASPRNLGIRILGYMTKRLYLGVDQITVVGRDMASLAKKKLGHLPKPITIIPNWADVDLVFPMEKKDNQLLKDLKLENKFIVQNAGNMGRAQGIENMFAAIKLLKEARNIHFIFIGGGAKRKWMQDEVQKERLENVTLLDQRPRSDQPNFLNASDIAMISLIPGMTGAGVPSRMYNAMAAGKPILAITEPESELAMVVNEEQIGWVVPPDQPARLAETLQKIVIQSDCLSQMGLRARAVAEGKYSPERVIKSYCTLLEGLG
jgi:colanic acid biosynthesis glycosyl transferase WcaI